MSVPEGEWNRRSQWEVRRDAQGLFRAYHVREVLPHRMIVTVSETTQGQEWKRWLLDGSPGAVRWTTYVVALPSQEIVNQYDHLAGGSISLPPTADRFTRLGQAVAAGDGVYAPGRRLIEEFAGYQKLWTGFYARPREVSTPVCPATGGLAPYAIGVKSCVELAGMELGDVLVKLWPWDYDDPVFESYLTINQAVRDRFQVGDPVRLEYLRPVDEEYELISRELTWPGFPYMDQPPSAAIVSFEERFLPLAQRPEKELLELMASQTGATEDNADLMRRLADCQAVTDPYRLPAMAATHKHPFLMEPVARYYLDSIPLPGPTDRITAQIRWLHKVYGTEPAPSRQGTYALHDYRDGDLEAHLDYIEAVLELAAEYNQRAFRDFSAAELQFMEETAPDLLEGFVNAHMMCFDQDLERQRRNVELLGMAHRLDMAALIRQAEGVSKLVDGDFLASLKQQMETSPDPVGRIAERDTPWGEIILDGTADNRYLRGTPAVLVNLGGNNFYANNTGSSIPGKVPSAVLVDFAGDDRYENWAPMRQGCGFMGVGILLDLDGDDSYIGVRYVQGTGFLGIGILADAAGDDIYRAIDYGQGVGQFGAGILLDDAGYNRYEGHQSCQGVGFTGGLGLLFSADPDGNDEYYNKGQHGTGYGDPGSFEGWGQGFGVGHRPYASGGIGILLDQGGDDRYEGGTFSLGGGYYYGLGILNNRAGNDRYRGSRYGMGFTAHQAVGIFLDDGGDDHYHISHFVGIGMAWDESNTLFIDRSGDDVYIAPSFAFGAAAQNGFALFIDGGGKDRYIGTQPAADRGNRYHGGTSIGYFLSLGEGEDQFPDRRPGELSSELAHSFFVDSPSIEAAMDSLRRIPLERTDTSE